MKPTNYRGTLSWGTLRPEDLTERFISFLEWEEHPSAIKLRNEWNSFEKEETLSGLTLVNSDEYELLSYPLWEDIWNAMEDLAPDGFYFGSTEGDGSDFGYWPVEMKKKRKRKRK